MQNKDILIDRKETIKNALKKLDKTAEKVLLVVSQEKKLLGTVTDGDIRRYILKGRSLEDSISTTYNRKPVFIYEKDFSMEIARALLIDKSIDLIPVLNDKEFVVNYITWGKAFSEKRAYDKNLEDLKIPVVIMAGGKGARLEPFSRILPKPLIPIGDKPIIEIIIEEFRKCGIRTFYVTLNYKGKMIESYFDSIEKNYDIRYVWDGASSGTIASLKFLKKEMKDTFIVSNCDVIVKADFAEVIKLHKKKKAALTILSSIQHYKIPYGVIKIIARGEVSGITEKPEYSFIVNTGVYVVDKRALRLIPDKSSFDMTDLISRLVKEGEKIITYPVNESDYTDIGQWEDYKKSFRKLSNI